MCDARALPAATLHPRFSPVRACTLVVAAVSRHARVPASAAAHGTFFSRRNTPTRAESRHTPEGPRRGTKLQLLLLLGEFFHFFFDEHAFFKGGNPKGETPTERLSQEEADRNHRGSLYENQRPWYPTTRPHPLPPNKSSRGPGKSAGLSI